jgi:hypothetical protein
LLQILLNSFVFLFLYFLFFSLTLFS